MPKFQVYILSEGDWLVLYSYKTDQGLRKRLNFFAKYAPKGQVLVTRPLLEEQYKVEFVSGGWELVRLYGEDKVQLGYFA